MQQHIGSSRLLGNTLLVCSAMVLAGLLVVQLGKLGDRGRGLTPEAVAAMASMGDGSISRVGDYTTMTFNAGNDDVLAVLDSRGEQLFLYRVSAGAGKELAFVGREDLKQVFTTARRGGPGRK